MNKFLLSAAAVACVAMSANAYTNFVKNGDFEIKEGVEQNTPWDFDESKHNLQALPGWNLVGLNDWSVLAMLVEPEIDDEFTFDGNTQCLHLYRFDDNGWQAGTVSQIVEGLTPGTEYVLGAIIARAGGETVDWDNPYFSISLMPLNEQGEEFGESVLFDDRDEKLAESDIWSAYEHKFTPKTSKVRLDITHNNVKWEGNHSEGFWMDVDDVAIMTPEDYAEYFASKGAAGVEAVAADAAVLGVYNLQGIKVADSVEALGAAKGIYVVKTTEGAKKVAL